MTLMHSDDIRVALAEGIIEIENFSDQSLEPASYDCRLGDKAINSSHRELAHPDRRGLFTIPAGDFALVKTFERIRLSAKAAGHIGLRSHYAKRGLDILAGPQIDPGFEGYLIVDLTNLSPRDVTIPYKGEFCAIEFYRFAKDVSQPYTGEYQGQAGITGQDLEALVDAQGMTFGEVIRSLGVMNSNVSDLSHQVKLMTWAIPILLTIGMATLGVLVALN